MNTLDNLILFILVAVLIFYCYKKKKFPFKRKTDEKETQDRPENTASAPINPFYPYMYPQGIQMPVNFTSAPVHASQCELVSFAFNPVFDEKALADETVSNDISTLESALNEKMRAITLRGCTITGINSLSYNLGDPLIHVVYCIAYGRQ